MCSKYGIGNHKKKNSHTQIINPKYFSLRAFLNMNNCENFDFFVEIFVNFHTQQGRWQKLMYM